MLFSDFFDFWQKKVVESKHLYETFDNLQQLKLVICVEGSYFMVKSIFFNFLWLITLQITLPAIFYVTRPPPHSAKLKYLVILLFKVINYSIGFDFDVRAWNLPGSFHRLSWKFDVTLLNPCPKKSHVTDELWAAVVLKLSKLIWTTWMAWGPFSFISYVTLPNSVTVHMHLQSTWGLQMSVGTKVCDDRVCIYLSFK